MGCGACKAPIYCLLPISSQPNPKTPTLNPKKPLILNHPSTSRRLFLISLPLSALATPFLPPVAASYDPVTQAERDASSVISRRISEAVGLLDKGRELQAKGDFDNALGYFTQVSSVGSVKTPNWLMWVADSI